MPYWTNRPPSAGNLRLFEPEVGWRAFDDRKDAEGKSIEFGASRTIELALSTALNASNLLVLTGAGSSFCSHNPDGKVAPGMTDLWDAVEEAVTKESIDEVIGLIPKAEKLNKNIEKLLTLSKLYVALFNDENSKKVASFIAKAENAIVERVQFVTDETDLNSHRTFVRKIARRGIRKPRAKIFTTNYDLCFEYAGREQQFVITDGFSHSTPQVYDRAHFTYDIVRRDREQEAPDYIENVFHLYKLHGSVDWKREGNRIVRSSDANKEPVLIYPRDSKYQEAFDAPYLDMMGAFQSAIRERDTALIVSGFGFKDDHICNPILAAIEANMSLRVVLCDVAFLSGDQLEAEPHILGADAPLNEAASPYFAKLKGLAVAGDQRISLLNGRFEDLAVALPDLVATTERERHMERVQLLRGSVLGGAEA